MIDGICIVNEHRLCNDFSPHRGSSIKAGQCSQAFLSSCVHITLLERSVSSYEDPWIVSAWHKPHGPWSLAGHYPGPYCPPYPSQQCSNPSQEIPSMQCSLTTQFALFLSFTADDICCNPRNFPSKKRAIFVLNYLVLIARRRSCDPSLLVLIINFEGLFLSFIPWYGVVLVLIRVWNQCLVLCDFIRKLSKMTDVPFSSKLKNFNRSNAQDFKPSQTNSALARSPLDFLHCNR